MASLLQTAFALSSGHVQKFALLAILVALIGMISFTTAETDYAKYNTRVGAQFLEAKAAEAGVVATGTGLLYKVLTKGSGTKFPSKSDTVKVHYRGTLINGKEFDSSYKRNSPASFGVTQVIAGWTEALQLMTVGTKLELYIPSELGYGARGAGRDIGPNATLVFEVELLEIVGSKDDL